MRRYWGMRMAQYIYHVAYQHKPQSPLNGFLERILKAYFQLEGNVRQTKQLK